MKITALNLALKRAGYLVGAIVVAVVAPELIADGPFEWDVVLNGSRVALGYWLLATFRDWQDPSIKNT